MKRIPPANVQATLLKQLPDSALHHTFPLLHFASEAIPSSERESKRTSSKQTPTCLGQSLVFSCPREPYPVFEASPTLKPSWYSSATLTYTFLISISDKNLSLIENYRDFFCKSRVSPFLKRNLQLRQEKIYAGIIISEAFHLSNDETT